MEDAYKIVRHDALIEAAKEQGAQEAAKTQAEKKKVASVGGQNQKTSAPKEKRNLDQILDENFDKYFEQ